MSAVTGAVRVNMAVDTLARRSWLADFTLAPGEVLVKKTGARVRLTPAQIAEAREWFVYFLTVKARALSPSRAGPRIAFTPDPVRPWYLIWPTLLEAGLRVVDDPATADIVMHFDDSTASPLTPPSIRPGARLINFGCGDISKSRVAAAFEDAFGYPLSLDPRTHHGLAVEKSERNGAHDGRVVTCPMEPLPGRVYQPLIDNRRGVDLVEDIRTPTIGGRPGCVFLKRRPVHSRFANANTEAVLADPADVFSTDDLAGIARFTEKLGLEWGGLDILRDAQDGRLYIVDANKTDMGPPTALPLRDKLRATRLLAHAFTDFIQQPTIPA